MLNKILELLQTRGTLSVTEIALALQSDASAIRPMLDLLEQKGKIKKLPLPCSGSCAGCAGSCASLDAMTYYQI